MTQRNPLQMDPNEHVLFDAMPFFRIYESRRIERFNIVDIIPPSVDPTTGVSSTDKLILPDIGVSARFYFPKTEENSSDKLPIIVYYHGGGFCVGSKSMSPLHNHLNSLAARANAIIVSVDYRLAPEHSVDVAYEDCLLALKWVVSGQDELSLSDRADFSRVYVSGESAGGNIAHMVATKLVNNNNISISGLILIHPYFVGTEVTESDGFDTKMSSGLRRLWGILCPTERGFEDYRINPMVEGRPSLGDIQVLVCVAGKDPLRDGGRKYCEWLKKSGWGGELEVFEARDEGHVFHVYKPGADQTLAQDEKICQFILKGKGNKD